VDIDHWLGSRDAAPNLDLDIPLVYDLALLLLHPWSAPTFISIVSPDADPEHISTRIRDDATLLIGDLSRWTISHEYIGASAVLGGRVDRLLVSCIPRSSESIGSLVTMSTCIVRSTLSVSAHYLTAFNPTGTAVAIGYFSGWIEIVAVRDGELVSASYARAESTDATVRAVATVLTRARIESPSITSLLAFGHRSPSIRSEAVSSAMRLENVWMNGRDLFSSTSKPMSSDPAYFSACAGIHAQLIPHV